MESHQQQQFEDAQESRDAENDTPAAKSFTTLTSVNPYNLAAEADPDEHEPATPERNETTPRQASKTPGSANSSRFVSQEATPTTAAKRKARNDRKSVISRGKTINKTLAEIKLERGWSGILLLTNGNDYVYCGDDDLTFRLRAGVPLVEDTEALRKKGTRVKIDEQAMFAMVSAKAKQKSATPQPSTSSESNPAPRMTEEDVPVAPGPSREPAESDRDAVRRRLNMVSGATEKKAPAKKRRLASRQVKEPTFRECQMVCHICQVRHKSKEDARIHEDWIPCVKCELYFHEKKCAPLGGEHNAFEEFVCWNCITLGKAPRDSDSDSD